MFFWGINSKKSITFMDLKSYRTFTSAQITHQKRTPFVAAYDTENTSTWGPRLTFRSQSQLFLHTKAVTL